MIPPLLDPHAMNAAAPRDRWLWITASLIWTDGTRTVSEDQQTTADRYLSEGMDRETIPHPRINPLASLRSQRAKPQPKRKEAVK